MIDEIRVGPSINKAQKELVEFLSSYEELKFILYCLRTDLEDEGWQGEAHDLVAAISAEINSYAEQLRAICESFAVDTYYLLDDAEKFAGESHNVQMIKGW